MRAKPSRTFTHVVGVLRLRADARKADEILQLPDKTRKVLPSVADGRVDDHPTTMFGLFAIHRPMPRLAWQIVEIEALGIRGEPAKTWIVRAHLDSVVAEVDREAFLMI